MPDVNTGGAHHIFEAIVLPVLNRPPPSSIRGAPGRAKMSPMVAAQSRSVLPSFGTNQRSNFSLFHTSVVDLMYLPSQLLDVSFFCRTFSLPLLPHPCSLPSTMSHFHVMCLPRVIFDCNFCFMSTYFSPKKGGGD